MSDAHGSDKGEGMCPMGAGSLILVDCRAGCCYNTVDEPIPSSPRD